MRNNVVTQLSTDGSDESTLYMYMFIIAYNMTQLTLIADSRTMYVFAPVVAGPAHRQG